MGYKSYYWAKPEVQVDQARLFYPTLEQSISEDHPVRLFKELLDEYDWSEWEAEYDLTKGQPPIHPKIIAQAIIYGLNLGIRSTRKLEDACRNRVDFMWLVEGRTIDHSTFACFRTKFKNQIKSLFKQIGCHLYYLGYIKLEEVATDGTQVRANSSRHRTINRETLDKLVKQLEKEIEDIMKEWESTEGGEPSSYGKNKSSDLPQRLESKLKRKELYDKMRNEFDSMEEDHKRSRHDKAPEKNYISMTDIKSRVTPNKDGGHAPNYSPVISTDKENGFIVSPEVMKTENERQIQPDMAEDIKDTYGRYPVAMSGDKLYNTIQNVTELEDRGIKSYTPVPLKEYEENNYARREDPSKPVAEKYWKYLPRNEKTKRLDRACFVYDKKLNCYYCPQGRRLLVHQRNKKEKRKHGYVTYTMYRSRDCSDCPLTSLCKAPRTKYRTVKRPVGQETMEKVARRMKSEEAKHKLRNRMHLAETPFAYIKTVMGVRQFLLRGLEKVNTEWMWVCNAYNIGKFVRLLQVKGSKCVSRSKMSVKMA